MSCWQARGTNSRHMRSGHIHALYTGWCLICLRADNGKIEAVPERSFSRTPVSTTGRDKRKKRFTSEVEVYSSRHPENVCVGRMRETSEASPRVGRVEGQKHTAYRRSIVSSSRLVERRKNIELVRPPPIRPHAPTLNFEDKHSTLDLTQQHQREKGHTPQASC